MKRILFQRISFQWLWKYLTIVLLAAVLAIGIFLCKIDQLCRREEAFTAELKRQLEQSQSEKGMKDRRKAIDDRQAGFFEKALPAKRLKELAESFWDYKLEVDGVKKPIEPLKIGGNGSRHGQIVIKLSQTEWERVLPQKIHDMGAVGKGDADDSFDSHLSVMNTAMSAAHFTKTVKTVSGKDPETGRTFRKTTVTYVFDALPGGQAIDIIPSPMFNGMK